MSVKSSTELMLYVVLTMPTLNKAFFIYLFIYYVYLTIILEIMHFSVNELKRCLITLHLSLNDLLRRSVDLMRSAYTNHYQTRTIRRNRNSNKIVLSGSWVFRATVLSKAAVTFVLVLVLTVSLVSCSTSSVKKLIM